MTNDDKLNLDKLKALATASEAVTRPCDCALDSLQGWVRMPAEFPEQQMQAVGTLVEDPYQEATYTEYHRDGSDYWSANAPIAVHYYPYNRCSVLQCKVCARCCLYSWKRAAITWKSGSASSRPNGLSMYRCN